MVEGLTEEERHELTRLLATVYRNLLQMEKDRQAGNFNGNHL
jgi:Fe2+ or Zn2+ uptake regulation protein